MEHIWKIPTWLLRTVGNLLNICVLIGTSYVIRVFDAAARMVVKGVEAVTGAEVSRDRIPFHRQRYVNDPVYETENNIIDAQASLQKSKFPLSPEELIVRTKKLLSPDAELGCKQPDLLANDFQFAFPIVGPLSKQEFCTAFSGFKIRDAFPKAANNYFGFTVDPLEPNRVWFMTRSRLVHEGTLKFGKMELPATGKTIEVTPQVMSFSFDEEGRVYKLTGGLCDRTAGNTDGLGGVFGLIHTVGGTLPFPEGKPFRHSLEWEALAKRVPQLNIDWLEAFKSQDGQ